MELRWYAPGDAAFERGCGEALAVRMEVFVREQGFQNEADDVDPTAHHLVAAEGGRPVATARIYPGEGGAWHVGRVAALPEYRGRGLGGLLLREAERRAKELGARRAELSAQQRMEGFYAHLGYRRLGGVYYDEFCPHVKMEKEL